MRRILVCAPSGSGLREGCCSLVARLNDEFRLSVGHEDVEDTLEDMVQAPIRQVVRQTRHEAIRQWQDALKSSIGTLKASRKKIQILSCHLTLYNGVRKEFYSPVAPAIFLGLGFRPDRLVILFDDIFDMFRALSVDDPKDSRKSGIFSPSLGEPPFLDRAARSLNLSEAESLDATQLGYLRTEYRVQALTQLLAWRRAETIQAELLARQIGAEFLPYGVKNAIDGLVTACRLPSDDSKPLYVSHPISEPRRQTRKGDGWPSVVDECNRLPEILARDGCIPIMPTAIDEYRLEQPGDGLFVRSPLLSPRWPKQPAAAGLIRADAASFSDAERSLLLPDGYDDFPEEYRVAIAGLMRGLEASISAEVPFRDHLIVAHVRDLLVFRPLYGKSRFSGGVDHEIRHWADLANEDPEGRHIVYVHTYEDVTNALRQIEADPTRFGTWGQFFEKDLRKTLQSRYSVSATAEEVWSIFRGRRPDDLLGSMPLTADQVKELRSGSILVATVHFAVGALTSLGHEFNRFEAFLSESPDPHVGLFLAESPESIDNTFLKRVVNFLNDSGPADDFRKAIDEAIDEGLVSWGERLAKRWLSFPSSEDLGSVPES